jgi:hypothetical protein
MHDFIKKSLGVTGLLQEDHDQVSLMVTLERFGPSIPMLTPVLVSNMAIMSGDSLVGCSYFPANHKAESYKHKFSGYFQSFRLIESRGLLEGHEVKDVVSFDFNKIAKVKEYVRSVGALTFRMFDIQEIINYVEHINEWSKVFGYACMPKFFDFNKTQPLSIDKYPEDSLAMFITMIDLPLAIPIYNRKKVDGIAMIMGFYWPESSSYVSSLYISKEINIVLSNYQENVICVDGEYINSPTEVASLQKRLVMGNVRKQLELERHRAVERSEQKKQKIEPEKKIKLK